MKSSEMQEMQEGYPTEQELQQIEQWDHADGWLRLMEFVHARWSYAEQAWKESEEPAFGGGQERVYRISTMGWSGNESLLLALRGNRLFWSQAWWESRRGGHYEFRLTLEE